MGRYSRRPFPRKTWLTQGTVLGCITHVTHQRSCHPPAPELPLSGPEGPRFGAGAAQ